jgi:chloramphenicol 3-O phosphotransferase
VSTDVIVLNGGSSSGKSSIARCLQGMLARPWLTLGVDDLVEAVPQQRVADGSLLSFETNGLVEVGPAWEQLEDAWYQGLAAIARTGAGVIVDEVFLNGGRSQARLRTALVGLQVLWIGVRCDSAVAAARESVRPDRVVGMAESQADLVHVGVDYDLVIDTTRRTIEDAARAILGRVAA